MRTMYDACNPAHIPADAAMVAGYIYGPCAWPAYAWRRFPNAVKVRIATVASLDDGQVLDVESGDASPELAPGWAARARVRGQVPTIYCSVSAVPAVLREFRVHGVPPPLLWVAQWDGVAVLPSIAVAKQYVNDQARGYDVSAVADYWPGVDPAPTPSHKDEPMHLFDAPGNVGVYVLFEYSGRYVGVADGDDVTALIKSGATGPEPISELQHQRFLAAFPTPAPGAATTA